MLSAKRGDFQMFAVVQKEKVFNEILLNHFKENKVEIANSITKLFPFLESLRDRSFITEKLYSDSQEAYRNLVPIEKIVYNVLGYLEKMLDWSLLKILFSRVNLKEYPGLIEIQKSFEIELQDKYLSWERDGEEQKMSTAQPSCEQGAIQSGRTSESILDVMSMYLKTDYSVADPNEDLKVHPTHQECVQSEINQCTYENYTQPCFVKQEWKPNIAQNQVNEIIVISSDSESSDEEELLEIFAWEPEATMQTGEDCALWAPGPTAQLRNRQLLFEDEYHLDSIEGPKCPFSAP